MGAKSENGIKARVHWEASRASARLTGAPARFLKVYREVFDSRSLDFDELAFYLTNMHHTINRQFVNFLVVYFRALAERHDMGLYLTGDEKLLYEDGKIIYNAIKFLDENG